MINIKTFNKDLIDYLAQNNIEYDIAEKTKKKRNIKPKSERTVEEQKKIDERMKKMRESKMNKRKAKVEEVVVEEEVTDKSIKTPPIPVEVRVLKKKSKPRKTKK